MRLCPFIHEAACRTGIEARDMVSIGVRQQAQVGNTTQVEHGPRLFCIGQQRMVKNGQQRRTLATASHIGPPKIGNHGNPAADGNSRRVSEL